MNVKLGVSPLMEGSHLSFFGMASGGSLKAEDFNSLQLFTCGNKQLDYHIHNGVIKGNNIVDEDGLYFKFTDSNTGKIIAVVSLASSGIIFQMSNYTHVLPAIKIDILAVDESYQKMHYDKESAVSKNPDDHYYFSDDIFANIVLHCRKISENMVLANFIVLYADKDAYRYYERNGLKDYSEYMIKENNQEINANIPMFFKLNE